MTYGADVDSRGTTPITNSIELRIALNDRLVQDTSVKFRDWGQIVLRGLSPVNSTSGEVDTTTGNLIGIEMLIRATVKTDSCTVPELFRLVHSMAVPVATPLQRIHATKSAPHFVNL